MSAIEQARKRIALWREDLRRFVVDNFNPEKIEPFQEEALLAASGEEMRPIPRIALKASKGPGKTTVLAWLGLGAMATRAHLNGACLSNTADNLRDNLWKEIAKWQIRSEFLKAAFVWTKTRYYAKDHEATWWLSFRTWPKGGSPDEQADSLAGLHQDNVIVLCDESGSYPSAIMSTADATLSSCKWGLIVQAGNPTHLDGPLYDAATKHRNKWVVITVNGDPDNKNRASRVSLEWAKDQIEMHGRDNPWVLVNVFGEFPPSSINTLLSPDEVEKCMARYGAMKERERNYAQKRIGCDTARFGDDPNVFFPRQGLLALSPVEMRHARGPALAARVALMKQRWGGHVAIFVDDTGGYGATLIDALFTAGVKTIPVAFSGKAQDPRYENKRAENWWRMAEWVKTYGMLPNMPAIVPELTKVEYTFTKKGKFIIESKQQIKSKIGHSPNYADALSLTFSNPELPDADEDHELAEVAAGMGQMDHEWDPYDPNRP